MFGANCFSKLWNEDLIGIELQVMNHKDSFPALLVKFSHVVPEIQDNGFGSEGSNQVKFGLDPVPHFQRAQF